MDGLGGNSVLQSKVAIVSPSSHSDADIDYTFIQIFPDQVAGISYKQNCGNIAAGVPVFALMKNMIPDIPDGKVTIKAFSTNTGKMMYMTLDVLNGEAKVRGETEISGIPGTGAEILVDFRDQIGGFTGKLFPTGNLIDTITMDDGSIIDVTIMDLVNVCAFFDAEMLGCTGLELPAPTGAILEPDGMLDKVSELRLRVARLIGWDHYTPASIKETALPMAVSVTAPVEYGDINGEKVFDNKMDLVARFYAISILHTAAPGSGSTTLAAAASIPGTIPNKVLKEGDLKSGKGGNFTFGHPSGVFSVNSKPDLCESINDIKFKQLSFPRTARIICDGTVYIKNINPHKYTWTEVDNISPESLFIYSDKLNIQK